MGCFFRIQKLLTCEYKELEETVLAESPFAQVSDSGIGIRQVQLALTPTKLLIAADSFSKELSNDYSNVYFVHEDPEIESLELVSLYPLDYLQIQIYKTELRQLMAITLPNQKELFFEFGGHFLKHLYYNIWRDRISNRELFITVEDESGSSREYDNSKQLQVLADVHANPGPYDDETRYDIYEKEHVGWPNIFEGEANVVPFKGTCLYKTMASEQNSTSWSTISLPEKSHRNCRQEFMETKSENVVGAKRTCRFDFMEHHTKPTSTGDIYSCWTTWN